MQKLGKEENKLIIIERGNNITQPKKREENKKLALFSENREK